MKNDRMKIARKKSDMTQEELALAIGVSKQTISLIESGKQNPALKTCIAICKALDKTLDGLFWEEK